MLAASYLPWSAQEKLAVIITDAPCHGKDGDFCELQNGHFSWKIPWKVPWIWGQIPQTFSNEGGG
jgi:hypothetical protein